MLFSSEETLNAHAGTCDHRFVILRVIRRHFTRAREKRKSTQLKIPRDRCVRETLRQIALLARKTYFRITAHQNVIVILERRISSNEDVFPKGATRHSIAQKERVYGRREGPRTVLNAPHDST